MAAALPIIAGESGLARYLAEIKRFPMLEPQEEYMLAKRWREHGDRDAAHKLVTSHLRLVAKIAMGYRGYGLPIGEVISEGNVGLMQAVKRFEPDKGFKLATYAMWWIRASIQEYILRSWSLVKMGTTASQKKLFFNLRKAKSRISALEEGDLRDDQVATIAQRLGVAKQDVIDMNRRLGGDASLNAPLREEGEGEWQDWLVDDTADQESLLADREECRRPHGRAAQRADRPQSARAAYFRGAAACRRADHAGGAVRRIRRLARARAADRGAGVREGASRRSRLASPRCRRRKIARRPRCRRGEERGRRGGREILSRRRPESEIGWRGKLLNRKGRPMPANRPRRSRSARRFALASFAAAALCAFPALAADRPATPEGAEALKALIAKYLPAAQAGASPLVTVTAEGANYLISVDLSALNALLRDQRRPDPATIVYKAISRMTGIGDSRWIAPPHRFSPKGGERQPRIGEFSIDGAPQSGHRLAPRRLGEHGQGSPPDSHAEGGGDGRIRPRAGDRNHHRRRPFGAARW